MEFKVIGRDDEDYVAGLRAGRMARDFGLGLTLYHEVGTDDYAKGFRAGFFNRVSLSGTWLADGGRDQAPEQRASIADSSTL